MHGAWHGSWCWELVLPLLRERGVDVRTVQLPSASGFALRNPDLAQDALAVRKAIDQAPGDVVVCGHAYGGMVISHSVVGNHPRTAHLVYLGAWVPGDGQSLRDIQGNRPSWLHEYSGRTLPNLSAAASLFYHDCDPVTQQWAIRRLRPTSAATGFDRVHVPAWHTVPASYIVCMQDRVLPAFLQKCLFVRRADQCWQLNAGHAPFLSQPGLLAYLLAACVTRIPLKPPRVEGRRFSPIARTL